MSGEGRGGGDDEDFAPALSQWTPPIRSGGKRGRPHGSNSTTTSGHSSCVEEGTPETPPGKPTRRSRSHTPRTRQTTLAFTPSQPTVIFRRPLHLPGTLGVPSLLDLCVDVVASHVTTVQGFGDVPHHLVHLILTRVVEMDLLDPDTLLLFLETDVSSIDFSSLSSSRRMSFSTSSLLRLGTCTTLRELKLSECESVTTDVLRAVLDGCSRLTTLHVDGCFLLSDRSFEDINRAGLLQRSSLTSLNLASLDNISDESLKIVANSLPELISLGVSHCNISDDGLTFVASRCSLQHLDIAHCSRVSDEGIEGLARVNTTLVSLILSANEQLSDTSINTVAMVWGLQLTTLGLARLGTNVTIEGMALLLGQCAVLESLDAERTPSFAERAVLALASAKPPLRKLLASGCDISPVALSSLANACAEHLEHVDVSFARDLRDEDLSILIKHCTTLRRVDVWGCLHLTEETLKTLERQGIWVVGRSFPR